MTIGELIDKLSKYDHELEVIVEHPSKTTEYTIQKLVYTEENSFSHLKIVPSQHPI